MSLEVSTMSSMMSVRPVSEQAGLSSVAPQPLPSTVLPAPCTLMLHSGESFLVRAIRADDTERLREFHRQLSPESIIFRFFRYMPELSVEDAQRFTHVDYEGRMALVATRWSSEREEILGVVRYEHMRPQTAEVAFVVEDHWQGHGIATALLHRLADYARQRGYTTFVAFTMGTNSRMITVLRKSGFPCTIHYATGEVEVHLDITQPVQAL